jgi:hypothetical protein
MSEDGANIEARIAITPTSTRGRSTGSHLEFEIGYCVFDSSSDFKYRCPLFDVRLLLFKPADDTGDAPR